MEIQRYEIQPADPTVRLIKTQSSVGEWVQWKDFEKLIKEKDAIIAHLSRRWFKPRETVKK